MADYEYKTTQSDGPMVIYHPEEEEISFYRLDDLLWEYNFRVQTDSKFGQGKQMLSFSSPLRFQGEETHLIPLSQEEAKKAQPPQEKKDWWYRTKTTLIAALPVIISSIPDIKEAFRIKTLIKELGILGEIYYKMAEEKIYVIIKGNPRSRNFLTGTRYGNDNPKIVKLGLSKVNFAKAFKGTAVVALVFYGLAKTVEGVTMYLKSGEIRSGFFSEIPAEVSKLLLSSLAAVGTAVFLTTLGAPIALAAATALVVGYAASVALDKFDEKIGFTKAVREVTENLTMNMRREWVNFKSTLTEAARRKIEQERDAAIQLLLIKAKQGVKKAFNVDRFPVPWIPNPLRNSIRFNNPLEGLEQLFRTARQTIDYINNVVSYKLNIF